MDTKIIYAKSILGELSEKELKYLEIENKFEFTSLGRLNFLILFLKICREFDINDLDPILILTELEYKDLIKLYKDIKKVELIICLIILI